MPDLHIKQGGSWTAIVRPYVKVAGVWQGCQRVYAKVAGTWQQVWEWLAVTLPNVNASTATAGECDCFFKIDNDGDYYESAATGLYGASSGTWLTAGTTSQVWVERTIVSGSLDLDTIGASRVATTTDREIGVTRVAPGFATANVTLDFYDAASGGNLLDTADINLSAENTGGG